MPIFSDKCRRIIVTALYITLFILLSHNYSMMKIQFNYTKDVYASTSDAHIFQRFHEPNTSIPTHIHARTTHPLPIPSSTILGYQVTFVVPAADLCASEEDTPSRDLLLVLVHSSVTNRPQRDAIRATWGRDAKGLGLRTDSVTVVVVFLVGQSKDEELNAKVLRESRSYQDMVVADFLDTYHNLSLKAATGMSWAWRFCPQAQRLLKLDDDVYLDVRSLSRRLAQSSLPEDSTLRQHGLVGTVNRHSAVARKGLWALSHQQHPKDHFPPYCSGNSYLLNRTVVGFLLETLHGLTLYSPRTFTNSLTPKPVPSDESVTPRFVPLEDVYITGYLAAAHNITCHDHPGFPHWVTGPTRKNICLLKSGKLFALHNVYYEKMYGVHNAFLSDRTCER